MEVTPCNKIIIIIIIIIIILIMILKIIIISLFILIENWSAEHRGQAGILNRWSAMTTEKKTYKRVMNAKDL